MQRLGEDRKATKIKTLHQEHTLHTPWKLEEDIEIKTNKSDKDKNHFCTK